MTKSDETSCKINQSLAKLKLKKFNISSIIWFRISAIKITSKAELLAA